MDNRDTLRNLLIAGAVFVLVMAVMSRIMPSPPTGPGATGPAPGGAATPSAPPTISAGGEPSLVGAAELSSARPDAAEAGGFRVVEAEETVEREMGTAPADGLTKGSPPSPYRMHLSLSNVGASVDTATLSDHAETIKGQARYKLLEPVEQIDGTVLRSLAVDKVNVDDADLTLHDKRWQAGPVTETDTGQTVSFWIEIEKDAAPALKLTRTFTLPRQAKEDGRHDLASSLRIENLSGVSRQVVVTQRGGVGVRQVSPRGDDRYIDWGLFDGARVAGNRKTDADVLRHPDQPLPLYAPSPEAPETRLSWVATANTYFTCTIAPLDAGDQDNPKTLSSVSAVDLDGSAATVHDVTVRFVSKPETIAAGQAAVFPADVYIGEKDGKAFRDVPKYRDRDYYSQVSMGFGACTFSWLVELMINLLNGLVVITRDYGVAIIIMVLVVRALLHPITKKGQVNMVKMQHRMQEMAPKIEEIKKKYANDKARMNQEMMKLNINPAGQLLTCLPMVIQMPIWVALYLSLSSNIQIRHEPFLFTWVHDLTAPDALYTFASPITVPLVGWVLPDFNLLPLLLAVFMYLQQKTQPKPKASPNMTEQQKQQQQMMQTMMPMMSIMMLLFFYKAPSGLNLYIMCSSFFGMIEQHYIRKHIKEREEAGTLHKPEKPKTDEPPRKKRADQMTFFEKLQNMADQAQKSQAKRQPKGKVRR